MGQVVGEHPPEGLAFALGIRWEGRASRRKWWGKSGPSRGNRVSLQAEISSTEKGKWLESGEKGRGAGARGQRGRGECARVLMATFHGGLLSGRCAHISFLSLL